MNWLIILRYHTLSNMPNVYKIDILYQELY